jgi:hypothetical protein
MNPKKKGDYIFTIYFTLFLCFTAKYYNVSFREKESNLQGNKKVYYEIPVNVHKS